MSPGSRNADRSRLYLAFLSVYLFWGSSYLASRVGVLHMPPFLFAGVRFTIAGAIMLLISRLYRTRVLPQRSEWRHLAVLACCGFLVCNGLSIWTLQYVSSNQAALLNASVPCWIVLLGAFGRRAHRPGRREMLGVLLGVTGTVMVIGQGVGTSGPLGAQLMILAGCFTWAVSTIYLRNSGITIPVLALIGWQMLLGGLSLLLLGLITGELSRWHWNWQGAISMAYLIVFASCCAHTAHAWLATHTTPAKLGTYGYVNPTIAAALGWLVLDEKLGALQLLGMVVVLAGMLMINWPRAGRTDAH